MRTPTLVTACVTGGLFLAALSSAAQAQAPGQTPAPRLVPSAAVQAETTTVTKRYGWQIVAVDAANVLTAVASEDGQLFMVGYLAGGPIVHFANGQTMRGLASLGVRVGLPMLGFVIGAGATQGCGAADEDDWCEIEGMFLGGLVGMGAAAILDWTVLAKKTTKVAGRSGRRGVFEYRGVAASPGVAPLRGGATLGLSGSF